MLRPRYSLLNVEAGNTKGESETRASAGADNDYFANAILTAGYTLFINSIACLMTFPQLLPKRLLHRVRPSVWVTNLWHGYPKWREERFPWHAAFPNFYFFCLTGASIVQIIYVCIYIHIWLRTDCIWITVPTKWQSEIFLHKSGAVRSVDWIFITGPPVWRRLDEYVTLDKTF